METLERSEREFIAAVLSKVIDAMGKEEEGFYTDGGRFMLSLSHEQMQQLNQINNKLCEI
jgi:hypothetical protein